MTSSEFLHYLVRTSQSNPGTERLPPLKDLSSALGISVSRLREQLEVAKALGFVDVRPRLGIRLLPYSFTPAINVSLDYAVARTPESFEDFLDLRRHIEQAYLPKALDTLTEDDFQTLADLLDSAWEKLRGRPVRIPHQEHRQFHLTIFRRLGNVFVTGILEAYWNAYESVGLNVYADLEYLEEVWNYHQLLMEALQEGRLEKGIQLLTDHFDLLIDRLVSR
jgi:DNA-binding FadR family transcriptional regulator